MKNDILIFALYLKKLFCLKNIFLFSIIFGCVFAVVFPIGRMYSNLEVKCHWYVMFFSMYIGIVVNYSYIYLKKNNFEDINHNSTINGIIVILLFLVLFALLFFVVLFRNTYPNKWDYYFIYSLFINYISLIFFELMFLVMLSSFSSVKFNYFWIIIFFVFNLIFVFWGETIVMGSAFGSKYQSWSFIYIFGLEIFITTFSINVVLIGLNFLLRIPIVKEKLLNFKRRFKA